MKRILFISLCLVFIKIKTDAQNLVPNPDFETYSLCPNWWSSPGDDQIARCTGWDYLSPGVGGTSDYYNSCGTMFMNDQLAHSGTGYAGIYTYEPANSQYREYLQVQLTSPLVSGTTYTVRMYAVSANGSPGYAKACLTNGLGFYFKSSQVTTNSTKCLNVTPQVESLSILADSVNWTLISGSFVAGGGEQWLVIGCFENDNNISVTGYSASAPAAYYLIDDVSVTSGVLPIQLISFEAKQSEEGLILLDWQITPENNNDKFIIEKSPDGKIFEETGKVKGAAGNPSIALNYNFIDREPFAGTSYYRLKQVDYDGKFIYSKVISITEQRNTLEVDIYPNPAKDIITLDIGRNIKNMKTEAEIYDVLGRKILKFEIENPESATSGKSEINISSLSKGMYFLKVTNGAGLTQTKFIKE